MRLVPAVLALAAVLASACTPATEGFVARSAAACLAPASDSNAVSLPSLVDRADVVVLAAVVRTETPPTPSGAARDLPVFVGEGQGQRVTLRTTETAKGSVPSEFAVYDGPCLVISAKTGESLVLFLEDVANPDGTLRPIGLPISVLRATPERSLAQLMTALRAIRPLDGDARALFERYGWKVSGKYMVDEFTVPGAAEFAFAGRQLRTMGAQLVEPFERYAALSATVGFDPRPYAGKPAELLTYFLEGKRFAPGAALGHVLIAERQIVGAWVSLMPEYRTFSLRDRAAVLAAPPSTPGRAAPPTNRVPQGINITRAYDLASARSIAFKTGAGGSATITDPAKIRAFAAALDETLATVQAPLDNAQPATRYWFSVDFATGSLLLQYDTSDGMLMVFLDGFSAKAPARFAALVADLR